MDVRIEKSKANGIIIAEPSKSYAHRLLIASALTKENCFIDNVVDSNDIISTINGLTSLGFLIEKEQNGYKTRGFKKQTNVIIDAKESGSTLRFLIPIAMVFYDHFKIVGTIKLFSRGLDEYLKIFDEFGIKYILNEDSLEVFSKLVFGDFKLKGNVSSQYITGLLFALPLLESSSTIEVTTELESSSYIRITLDVLESFGIKISYNEDYSSFKILGNQKYLKKDSLVEGDYSNASFLDAFNYLGGNVIIAGLKENSLQGDSKYSEYFKQLNNGFSIIDLNDCIDLGPILFVFSCLKHGGHFINTKRLTIKESNRVQDVKTELEKAGSKITVFENEVIIKPGKFVNNVILDSHNDHRLAMAFSVLLSVIGGTIKNAECVKKSYPSFFDDLIKLNIMVII